MVFMKRSQFIGAKDQRLYIFYRKRQVIYTFQRFFKQTIIFKLNILTEENQGPQKFITTRNPVKINLKLPEMDCDSCETLKETYSLAIITFKSIQFEVFDQNIGFHRFITRETLSNHKTFNLSCFSTFTAGLTIKFVMIRLKFNLTRQCISFLLLFVKKEKTCAAKSEVKLVSF